MNPAPIFTISTSPRIPGARLSLAGQWGNLPYPDAAAAEAEARRIGGSAAIVRRSAAR